MYNSRNKKYFLFTIYIFKENIYMLSEIELQKGVYTQKALAEWIGICEKTLTRNKTKYLEELKEYAEYKVTESGKVNILYVKIPVYVKKDSNYQKVKK